MIVFHKWSNKGSGIKNAIFCRFMKYFAEGDILRNFTIRYKVCFRITGRQNRQLGCEAEAEGDGLQDHSSV